MNLRKAIWSPGVNVGTIGAQVLGEAMRGTRYSREFMLLIQRSTLEGRHLWNRWKIKGHQERLGGATREAK